MTAFRNDHSPVDFGVHGDRKASEGKASDSPLFVGAPRWQLVAPHRPAGEAVRALSWLGPDEVEVGLDVIRRKLSAEDLQELAASRAVMPAWMAEPVSGLVADG